YGHQAERLSHKSPKEGRKSVSANKDRTDENRNKRKYLFPPIRSSIHPTFLGRVGIKWYLQVLWHCPKHCGFLPVLRKKCFPLYQIFPKAERLSLCYAVS